MHAPEVAGSAVGCAQVLPPDGGAGRTGRRPRRPAHTDEELPAVAAAEEHVVRSHLAGAAHREPRHARGGPGRSGRKEQRRECGG